VHNACRAVSAVLALAGEARGERGSGGGADDFLPGLILTLVRAAPARLYSEVAYMADFLRPSKLAGELGYFLTALQSAVAFVKHVVPQYVGLSQADFDAACSGALLAGKGGGAGAGSDGGNEEEEEEEEDDDDDEAQAAAWYGVGRVPPSGGEAPLPPPPAVVAATMTTDSGRPSDAPPASAAAPVPPSPAAEAGEGSGCSLGADEDEDDDGAGEEDAPESPVDVLAPLLPALARVVAAARAAAAVH
jgi:hypothetical protein